MLIDQDSLCEAIAASKGILELLVYSSTTESIRHVTVQLEAQIYAIGCDLGNGFLHQIPRARMPWSNAHGNLELENSDYCDNTFVEDGLYPSFIPHVTKSNSPRENQHHVLGNEDYILEQ